MSVSRFTDQQLTHRNLLASNSSRHWGQFEKCLAAGRRGSNARWQARLALSSQDGNRDVTALRELGVTVTPSGWRAAASAAHHYSNPRALASLT